MQRTTYVKAFRWADRHICKERQVIELQKNIRDRFPHRYPVPPDNLDSLLEIYEDFFTICPEYRPCDLDKLEWRKPTFGNIPGHFSLKSSDRA